MANARELKSVLWVGIFLLFLCGNVFGLATPMMDQSRPTDDSAQGCLEAAKQALGSEAEVLKCGHLTRTDRLETVAAMRFRQFKTQGNSIPVARLVVLRQNGSQWETLLTADKQNWIRNNVGYVGLEFIDDSADFIGYRVSFSGEGVRETPGFTIWLNYLSPTGHNEGVATRISWNPSVGRFQEYTENDEPVGFRPEVKSPPHHRHGQKSP